MKTLSASLCLCVSAFLFTGCQTADPASRSNRTSYRDIRAEINGCSNSLTITVGDGLYASADGGGDAMEATATQTTDTKPEVAVGVGGGSAGTGGAAPQSGIVGRRSKTHVHPRHSTCTKLTADEAAAISDCASGLCSDTTTAK